MHQIERTCNKNLIDGLPKLKFDKDQLCDACMKGKQVKKTFKHQKEIFTSRPLQLLHMDLVGPTRTRSLGGSYYAYVVIDDYSRFTWVMFLTTKDEAFAYFEILANRVQNEQNNKIIAIRSDHGKEFENHKFIEYCESNGIFHSFSAPRTPQQNGVVERKNRTLQDMARTMLNEHNLPTYFWAEAMSTACYIANRFYIRSILEKTPFEIYFGKKPNISYFKAFGCKCFIHNNGKDNLGKFDAKSDEGIFLGYSNVSKAFRVYNTRTRLVEESIHVKFDETTNHVEKGKSFDDDAENLAWELGRTELHDDPSTNMHEERQKESESEK